LAHYKSEVERLERRQRQLEALFEELRVKTGEDIDEEDELGDSEALLRSADRIDDASNDEE
jgi:hypothetical protein